MKNIAVLGATGSVGSSVLSIIREFREDFRLIAISGWSNVDKLVQYVKEFSPKVVVVKDEVIGRFLRDKVSGKYELLYGIDGLVEAASLSDVDIVVVAVSGISGLRPSLSALECGKRVLLSNKEPMVAAGQLFRNYVEGSRLLPLDSEHNAIWQCLRGEEINRVKRIILTASGGPFRKYSMEELKNVQLSDVLRHPTWSMGKKITVDSATLVNKALEVIEARWIFGIGYERIDVVIHPQSIVHGIVEFVDGSIKMVAGVTDMRLPIQYALFYPDRRAQMGFGYLDIFTTLEFEKPDDIMFPALSYGYTVGKRGGLIPAAFVGADESAVSAFLEGKIRFLDIFRIVKEVVDSLWNEEGEVTIENVEKMIQRSGNLVDGIITRRSC